MEIDRVGGDEAAAVGEEEDGVDFGFRGRLCVGGRRWGGGRVDGGGDGGDVDGVGRDEFEWILVFELLEDGCGMGSLRAEVGEVDGPDSWDEGRGGGEGVGGVGHYAREIVVGCMVLIFWCRGLSVFAELF